MQSGNWYLVRHSRSGQTPGQQRVSGGAENERCDSRGSHPLRVVSSRDNDAQRSKALEHYSQERPLSILSNKSSRFQSFSRTLDSLLGNLANTGRSRKQAVSMVVDASLAGLCLWGAYSLRHGQVFSDFRSTWYLFVILPAFTVIAYSALGIYRWAIRSTNQRLYRQVVKGALVSALGLVLLAFLLPPDRVTPRSLFVIYAVLLVVGGCSVRAFWQSIFGVDRKGEPIAVYGAGSAGQRLVSLLNSGEEFRPVAFIDDDPALVDSHVVGLPVLAGDSVDLRAELARLDVVLAVLAIPSISRQSFDEKLARFDSIGLPLKTLPSVQDMMSGSFSAGEIRDVSINDILGRSEVTPDTAVIGRRVTGRTVLITGGGGSIGSELARQIAVLSPKRLVVLDSSEENLYEITEEMTRHPALGEERFVPCLGSVRQRGRLDQLMREHGVNTVFHAAAYKHVPIIEAQPEEGVETNVFGTRTVLESAIAHGVSDFVLISTDKAVRPTNAMGASKRAAELILQATAREDHGTCISMVRFGNVLGSSGSVVPKFKRQILEGGPVTITHRDITRYFMTIPEAAQLVLQASSIARGGDVFVLDMGEPVRILDLARTMIRLYGKTVRETENPFGDIAIVEQGLRPGEKMFEELFLTDSHVRTSVEKVFTADEAWIPMTQLESRLGDIRELLKSGCAVRIKAELIALAQAADVPDSARTGVVSSRASAVNEGNVDHERSAALT